MIEPLRARLESELDYAARARGAGQEGRARVCARRAAGWAVGVYRRTRRDEAVAERAALQHLRWLAAESSFPEPLRQAAARLTERINQAHQLPHRADPLEDARAIVQAVLQLLVDGATEVHPDR